MRKRRSRIVIALVLLPILCLVAPFLLLGFERLRGQIPLYFYKKNLVAHGAKLDPREFSSAAPSGDNGVPGLLAAAKELQEGAVMPRNCPPRMRLTPSGRAIVGFRQSSWTSDGKTYDWDQLAADLETNAAALREIRAALQKPGLDYQLDFSLGARTPLTHLAKAKSLAGWLGSSCELALHQRRNADALEAHLAEFQLVRSLEQSPVLISELVRFALAAIARNDSWELLQAEGWSDSDLARLQAQWQRLSFANSLPRAYEGERVFTIVTLQGARKSNDEAYNLWFGLAEFLGNSGSGDSSWKEFVPGGDETVKSVKKQFFCRLWRFAWLDQSELHDLRQIDGQIAIAIQAASSRSSIAVQPALDAFVEQSQHQNFYDRLRFPGEEISAGMTSRTVAHTLRAETERSLALAAIAIKRYSLRHGKVPGSLDALVPEFLASVPVDCMDGAPLRYRPRPDGTFLLYSVGEDGRDDGGDGSAPESDEGRVSKRKDLLWPEPAPAGE